jgi:hypothetical protein
MKTPHAWLILLGRCCESNEKFTYMIRPACTSALVAGRVFLVLFNMAGNDH